MRKKSPSRVMKSMPWLLPSAASGVLLGIAFPPLDLSWLVWVGLVPLLWAVYGESRNGPAFLSGLIAGMLFWLINLRPLVSAYLWSGWQDDIDLEAAQSQQYLALNILWVLLAVWSSLFWGLFTLILSRLVQGSILRLAVLGPPLFVLIAEWLRSLTEWDYQWAMLGNATVELDAIRQLAAFGGTSLLTWIVVLGNAAALAGLVHIKRPRQWAIPVSIFVTLGILWLTGLWQLQKTEGFLKDRPSISVAALQYYQPEYYFNDYARIGMEKDYLQLLHRIANGEAGRVSLLVLPESIAIAAVSLDGTKASTKPEDVQIPLQPWNETILGIIDESDLPLSIVMGLETVEDGNLHNSLVFWSPLGIEQRYHKQRLVPFSEYSPSLLNKLGLQGESSYSAGKQSALARVQNVTVGGFICQEVQIPSVTRRSVHDGAQLLVSGGNDGVFADPAVAGVHAKLARLRAVETGRYIVRAMKTGISAIISPTGDEVARSPGADPYVVTGTVQALNHQTLYSRRGDWPLLLAALTILGGIGFRLLFWESRRQNQ